MILINGKGITKSVSKEHTEYLKKVRMRKAIVLSLRLFLLAAIFVLWELLARMKLIDPFIMSQPSRIADTIVSLYREGKLFYHTGITCLETVVGFLLGTITGTIIAVVLCVRACQGAGTLSGRLNTSPK